MGHRAAFDKGLTTSWCAPPRFLHAVTRPRYAFFSRYTILTLDSIVSTTPKTLPLRSIGSERVKMEPLEVDNLNARLLKTEYAVRGAIAVKSADYQKQLREGAKLPFNKVLQCNIGE